MTNHKTYSVFNSQTELSARLRQSWRNVGVVIFEGYPSSATNLRLVRRFGGVHFQGEGLTSGVLQGQALSSSVRLGDHLC